MRPARPLLASALAVLIGAAAFAGVGVAQDQPANTTGEMAAPPDPSAAPASGLAPPDQALQAPPDEAAPPPEPAPTPTAQAADNADDDDNESGNAIAPAPPAPLKRPGHAVAVLQALDKVTAETLRFEATVNQPVRYKDLVITVHACESTAADEGFSENVASLDVQYQPEGLPGRAPQPARQVYHGWMFAGGPGLHPLEHPIYDVWMIACRTPAPAPAPAPGGASL